MAVVELGKVFVRKLFVITGTEKNCLCAFGRLLLRLEPIRESVRCLDFSELPGLRICRNMLFAGTVKYTLNILGVVYLAS